jgi:AmpD protein
MALQRENAFSVDQHRLIQAKQISSPNCDARPEGAVVSLIVVHCISLPPGEFSPQPVEAFFCNTLPEEGHPFFAEIAGLCVSSHLYIERNGAVTQFVPFDHRAWHAGRSAFAGRSACNDFSIGIELSGAEDVPYTAAQYEALVGVIYALHAAYPETQAQPVVGHSDIAPGRKTDPGAAFDWQQLADCGIDTLDAAQNRGVQGSSD